MQVTVKSISLSYAQVQAILQDWINANLLRTPHHVIDIDACDYDAANEMQFNLHLEPLPLVSDWSVLKPIPEPDDASVTLYAQPAGAIRPPSNGHTVQQAAIAHATHATQEVSTPAKPAARPKSRISITPEERDHVIRLKLDGLTNAKIAERLGLAEWRLYPIFAEARAQGQLPDRRVDTVA